MKAAYIQRTGPAAETIIYGDLPQPTPGPTECLVRMGAVAVNPIDTYIRNGANSWELPKPFIIGCDLAGTVEAVGAQVTQFKPGDRVWCTNQGLMGRQGTFAEYAAVDQGWLYPTPAGVSDEAAASCALVGITAHMGLFARAQLKPGETIFVNGGTGGVGSMVVQMAKNAGARVIATGGSDDKVAALLKLGCDAAVNYKTGDLAAAVKAFAPAGVNVYWETVREPNFDQIVPLVAERGRIILMAGRDARPAFPVGPFYVKGCSLLGFVMFKGAMGELRACAAEINRWLAEGKLHANISHRFPLRDAAAAHALQEQATLQRSGALAGKIVLTP